MKNIIGISDSLNCPHPTDIYFNLINTYTTLKSLIIRENHLSSIAYEKQLQEWLSFPNRNFELLVHSHGALALKYQQKNLHLPFTQFIKEHKLWLSSGLLLSTSVHSIDEAIYADSHGASFIIVGPIYKTTCKPTAIPKGISFLKEVQSIVKIPVYAIGGVSFGSKLNEVLLNGATGACMRSELWILPEKIKGAE